MKTYKTTTRGQSISLSPLDYEDCVLAKVDQFTGPTTFKTTYSPEYRQGNLNSQLYNVQSYSDESSHTQG